MRQYHAEPKADRIGQVQATEKTWPVGWVITHLRQHLDEYAARWALNRFGTTRYPRIDRAKVVEFDPRTHVDGRSEMEWLGDGYLFVGCGGGRYDDHPHDHFPDDCAFTLVLKDLGVADDPALAELKRHILFEDRNGAPHPLHLALVIKQLHRLLGDADIDNIVMTSLEALYLQQVSFQDALVIVRNPRCQVHVHHRSSGEDLVLVVVEDCDNEDVSRAARAKGIGLNAALVVHRNVEGHTYISGNTRIGTRDLSALVETLRTAEQEAKDEVIVVERDLLRSEGILSDIPEWHHLAGNGGAGQIFNGSLTAPEVPRTRLSTPQIQEYSIAFLRSCRLDPKGAPSPNHGSPRREHRGGPQGHRR